MKPFHRSILVPCWVLMAALLMSPTLGKSADGVAAGDDWLTVYQQAIEQAKTDKKVILADFTGSDWCPWCVKLKKDVFSTPEFRSWAKDHLVLLEVDFPRAKPQTAEVKQQNKMLQQKFASRGFPTCIFISSNGNELGRITGYAAPEKWMEQAKEIVQKANN